MQTSGSPVSFLSGKGKWIGLAVIVVLAGLIVWPGGHFYRQHKQRKLTTQARQSLDAGKYREAFLLTRQLLAANPQNVEACRFMAELTEHARDPSTLVWRQQVAQLAPTLENRLTLAAAAMLFERPPYPLAHQTLEGIAAADRTAAYHSIAAQLALKLNQLDEAETHFQEAIRLAPEKESHQLNLAVVRLQSRDPAVVAEARATLERFATHSQLGVFALRTLVSQSLDKKERERALQFSETLLAQPQAAFGDRVQHLNILFLSQSPGLEEFLGTLRTQASTNELQVHQLAGWMSARDRAAEALAWIESLPPERQRAQPVPQAVVECLLALKDWARLESFLKTQQWAGQEFVHLALTSLALRHQGLRDSAQLKLQEAVREAAKRAETLLLLSQTLESWGWQTEADELLQQVVKRFPNDRRATHAVSLIYYAKGNTAALYDVFNAMLKANSGDAATKNNLAMMCLLLNRDLDRAYQLAEEACESDPKNPSYVSTRAFALQWRGKPAEARALLETLPAAELESPGIALYYALALHANGESERARKFASRIPPGREARFLPEERRLLEELRKPQG